MLEFTSQLPISLIFFTNLAFLIHFLAEENVKIFISKVFESQGRFQNEEEVLKAVNHITFPCVDWNRMFFHCNKIHFILFVCLYIFISRILNLWLNEYKTIDSCSFIFCRELPACKECQNLWKLTIFTSPFQPSWNFLPPNSNVLSHEINWVTGSILPIKQINCLQFYRTSIVMNKVRGQVDRGIMYTLTASKYEKLKVELHFQFWNLISLIGWIIEKP